MSVTGWLIRRHVRQRWAALVPLLLIVALGATGTFVAAGAADRTSSAYGEYLTRAEVSDVVVNPSLFTSDIDQVIRDLPGVQSVTTDALFLADIDEGRPRPRAELDAESEWVLVRGSADGRYTAMDRPVLAEGRFPSGPREALVGVDTAEAYGVEVGDVVPLSFWSIADEMMTKPTDVVSPVGVEHVTVVGIATLPDEVLPDDLYPRDRLVVSPDVATRYDCLPDVPPVDASREEVVLQLLPPGCSAAYRYYSLEIESGAAGVGAALDTFLRESAELSPTIPNEAAALGAAYYLVATTTAEEQERVERSTQPTVTALAVLAAVTGVVTAVALGLAVARELRRTEDDRRRWWQLGVAMQQRAVVVVVPLLGTVAIGIAVALLAAWALSPVAPVGSVRAIEPSPARELSGWVMISALTLGGAGAIGTAGLAMWAARRATRADVERRRTVRAVPRLVRMAARPEIDEGVRAAYGGSRGAGLVVASCGLAVGVFLAAAVFAASLSAVLSTPASYGWPWDLAAMTGAGYGDLNLEAVESSLDRPDDVASWSVLGFTGDVAIDGEPVLAVFGLDHRPDLAFAVVEGRLPQRDDEVALGSRTAADRGIDVGDEVQLSGGSIGPRPVTVTGLAVLPPLGQFQADRLGPGNGIVLPMAMLEPDDVADLATFVGINLVPGADRATVFTELERDFVSWDRFGAEPYTYGQPVRPAEIVNVRSMRAVPLLVGGLLGGAAVVGLPVAVAVSVRSRRRELAILRALGFTGRQVRTSVRAQAIATMVAALVIGVPLGIAAGRVLWQAFAFRLGVVPDPATPVGWIVATVAGSITLAIVAAALPARVAARTKPAAALRTE